MSLSKKIMEFSNFKISKRTTESEADTLLSQKKQLRIRLYSILGEGEWECENYDCDYESKDLNSFLKHEVSCYNLEINIDNLIDMCVKHELYARLPENTTCKFCRSNFKTSNLLNQHQKRGNYMKCVPKTLKQLADTLSREQQMELIHIMREMKFKE
jgi:hypothetical protein